MSPSIHDLMQAVVFLVHANRGHSIVLFQGHNGIKIDAINVNDYVKSGSTDICVCERHAGIVWHSSCERWLPRREVEAFKRIILGGDDEYSS